MEQIVPTPGVSADPRVSDPGRERRSYQRLDIRLPVEVLIVGDESSPIRTTTRNVGAGGLYFEIPSGSLEAGANVRLSLSVPPGAGYFPYSGRGTSVAEVLRLDSLSPETHGSSRVGVAARFSQPLKFEF